MLPVLRARFPDAHLTMLLRKYTGTIIEGNPYVDELLWYDDGSSLTPFGEMRKILSDNRFDVAIVVYPTFRLAWLMFRSGIPVRVGTGYRYYSLLFTKRVFEHRKDAHRHEVEYNLNLLGELGCTLPSRPEFFISIPPEAEQRVVEVLHSAGLDAAKPLAIVHPGSGGSAREWSAENFGKLAARLTAGNRLQVVATGSASEGSLVELVVQSSGRSTVSLAGAFSTKELAALIRMSKLFVSNSTGPLHVAAAVGTPVVGLYPQHTPMHARRWGPLSTKSIVFTPKKPVYCSDCAGGKGEVCACMESISVGEVYAAACSLLDTTRVARETASRA